MISFTSDQRFIVTGASSGIGEGVALLLNELGATVVGIGRNQERLEGMKAKAKYPENVFLEQKDLVENISELPVYVKTLRDKYGKFHGMAYCAGILCVNPLRSVVYEDIQRIFAVNYFAPVFMAKGFADRRNNDGNRSVMVFMASGGGVHCDPGMTEYAGSKGALIATMQSVARELAPQGIRVNCVSPSIISTPMVGEIVRSYADGKYPFGIGTVADAANMVVYLLSEQAKWITAQNYFVDCGAM